MTDSAVLQPDAEQSDVAPAADTWWGKRFLDVLESFEIGERLDRGRRYADEGHVVDIEVTAGLVRARVQGRRSRPYVTEIVVFPLSRKDWAHVEEQLAARARYTAALLGGEIPHDVEEVFDELGLSLFPCSRRELHTDCTCPDWANPCKHVAAVYYELAEAFAADPFLIFEWRGRTREGLLGALRVRRSGGEVLDRAGAEFVPTVRTAALSDCLDSFWSAGLGEPQQVDPVVPTGPAAVPDAVIAGLDPLPLRTRGRAVGEVLSAAYEIFTAAVPVRIAAITGGDDSPAIGELMPVLDTLPDGVRTRLAALCPFVPDGEVGDLRVVDVVRARRVDDVVSALVEVLIDSDALTHMTEPDESDVDAAYWHGLARMSFGDLLPGCSRATVARVQASGVLDTRIEMAMRRGRVGPGDLLCRSPRELAELTNVGPKSVRRILASLLVASVQDVVVD